MVTRRRALNVVGAGLLGLAGCSSRGRDGTTTGTPGRSTRSASNTATTPSATDASTETDTPTQPPEPTDEVDVRGESPAWTRALDDPIRGPPVYVDGHVVVAAGETIYGLDAASGEVAWTIDSPVVPQLDALWVDATLHVEGGIVYALLGVTGGLGGGEYFLLALRPDGTEQWRYASDLHRVHEMAGVGGGAVVLPTHDDDFADGEEEVLAIDIDDGGERWRTKAGDSYFGAVSDGVAAIHVPDTTIDCLDLDTGDRRFRFEVDEPADVRSVAAGDGLVFARVDREGPSRPTLYAIEAADGDTAWTWNDMRVDSIRHVDDLYVGGGSIFRLASDGTVRWRYDGGGPVRDVPFDEECLYTNDGSHVVAISRRNGTETWRTPGSGELIPVARSSELVLATAGDGGRVSAYEVDGGARRWRATAPESFHTPATGGDGAYLASEGGSVVKLPT